MEERSGSVDYASFSPDGKLIVSASTFDEIVRIWDAESQQLVHTITIKSDEYANRVTLSPDWNKIAVKYFDRVRIWNVESGQLIQTWVGRRLKAAAFGPDGKHFFISDYKDIHAFNIVTAEEILCLKDIGFVDAIIFSPDGKRIAFASSDKNFLIMDFPPLQDLIDQTRERFKDKPLTAEERRSYYLE